MHPIPVSRHAWCNMLLLLPTIILAAKGEVSAGEAQAATEAPSTGLSHGPMLGAVSPTTAAIWLRTEAPCEVRLTLTSATGAEQTATLQTDESADNTAVARFEGLVPDTEYAYEIAAGAAPFRATFRTYGPSMKERVIRLGYGYGYNPGNRMKGDSIFTHMARREPDFVLFLGDFPYTLRASGPRSTNSTRRSAGTRASHP